MNRGNLGNMGGKGKHHKMKLNKEREHKYRKTSCDRELGKEYYTKNPLLFVHIIKEIC